MNTMIHAVVLLGRNCMSQGETGAEKAGPVPAPAMLMFAMMGRVGRGSSMSLISWYRVQVSVEDVTM